MAQLATNMPNPPDTPFVNMRTGCITEPWFIFLLQLFRRTGGTTGGDGQLTKSDALSFESLFPNVLQSQMSDYSPETVSALVSQLPDLSNEAAFALASQLSDFSEETVFAPRGAIDGVPIGLASPQKGFFVGVTDASNASAGIVGEFQAQSATGTAITTGTIVNAIGTTLQPGDWDVSGVVQYNPAGGAVMTFLQASVSTTSATINTSVGGRTVIQQTFGANLAQFFPVPIQRVSISVATAVYVTAFANFSPGTCSVDGYIRARRMR